MPPNRSTPASRKDTGASIRNALQQNLYRLLLIRSIVFCLQLFALGYAWAVVSLPLNYPLILGIFLVLGITNGLLYLRLQKQHQPNAREFLLHLAIDILGLTVLLFFTGGANNPFVSYFLVPVTIGAAALKRSFAVMLTLSALTCYTLLLFFYLPLPALTPMSDGMNMDHSTPALSLHVLGMWFNFLVSAALISWFVLKMAAENRDQEARLRKYREDTLRNEQIMAVATLAAGTAHELGTPLSSVTMLLREMQLDHAGNAQLQSEISMLQEQISNCRNSLHSLTRKADFTKIQTANMNLVLFIREVMEKWQLLRPEYHCTLSIMAGSSPQVMVDPTLQQALINMLNNAAESSSSGVKLDLEWDERNWTLKITDYGKGISRDLVEQLGTRIVSGKEGGMGVGVVLSQATLNRLGGSVSLYPLEEGGTLTEIMVPFRIEKEPDYA